MSQSEYARHVGCDRATVHKAIRQGYIACVDGKIDSRKADQQWAPQLRCYVRFPSKVIVANALKR